MIRELEYERFTITSSKPFEEVVSALTDAVGQPDIREFWIAMKATRTVTELENTVYGVIGRTGLMLFARFDHGAIVGKGETSSPKLIRFVIGNPLIMREMAKHVPDAGSYAPVTILVDERGDGVHLSYDTMTSLLSPYGNESALEIARSLDRKVEHLLQEAAA